MKSCSYKSFCSQANSQGYRAPGVKVHCCYSNDCNLTSSTSQPPGLNLLLLLCQLLMLGWFMTHVWAQSPNRDRNANRNAKLRCLFPTSHTFLVIGEDFQLDSIRLISASKVIRRKWTRNFCSFFFQFLRVLINHLSHPFWTTINKELLRQIFSKHLFI